MGDNDPSPDAASLMGSLIVSEGIMYSHIYCPIEYLEPC